MSNSVKNFLHVVPYNLAKIVHYAFFSHDLIVDISTDMLVSFID